MINEHDTSRCINPCMFFFFKYNLCFFKQKKKNTKKEKRSRDIEEEEEGILNSSVKWISFEKKKGLAPDHDKFHGN